MIHNFPTSLLFLGDGKPEVHYPDVFNSVGSILTGICTVGPFAAVRFDAKMNTLMCFEVNNLSE